MRLTLSYELPTGVWVYQPKSTQWLVLTVISDSPFRASGQSLEWHCFDADWTRSYPVAASLIPSEESILLADIGSVRIAAPFKPATASDPTLGWARETPGTALPLRHLDEHGPERRLHRRPGRLDYSGFGC